MKNILIAVVVAAVLLAISFTGVYNGIVAKHENIAARWAQVDNQLQRRIDLVPNLVSTVKGYAAHEKTVFEDVTNARSQWASASTINDKVKAASGMDSAISRLIAVAENYPELKADGTFLRLMDELSGAENRIAVERMRYNDAVMGFNVAVRRFPGNIVAGVFGYRPADQYFKSEEKAKKVPEVIF